jgi:hypothetical protein
MFRFTIRDVFSVCLGEPLPARRALRRCSFCRQDAKLLVEGVGGVLICKTCSEMAVSIFQMELCPGKRPNHRTPQLCSFCSRDARPMVEGPARVFVCKQCSEVALSMLQTQCRRGCELGR